MAIQVKGYAATSPAAPLGSFSFERRDLRDDDLLVEILYCGVCHTDIHQARNEWNGTRYPVVPGHEIIGKVMQVGKSVRRHRAGDLVGIGCMVDSCNDCSSCADGLEQYCLNTPTWTYNHTDRHDGRPTYGGYSQRIVVTERFALRLPPGLDPKSAAPLLCAGITTYSPLRHWKVGKGSSIAVVGLGGLGHMALKFARAFGAETTLFTRTAGKRDEAMRLGADHVVLSTDSAEMKHAGAFDLIVDTVPHPHALDPYVKVLRRDGTLVLVGLLMPIEPPLDAGLLVSGRKTIAGSVIGGLPETQEMLDFCAERSIGCDVELIAMNEINRAYDRMLKSDVRYRFVIDMGTLLAG